MCVCRSRQRELPSAATAFPTHGESLSDIRRLRNAVVVRKRKETKTVEGEMRLDKTNWFAVLTLSLLD